MIVPPDTPPPLFDHVGHRLFIWFITFEDINFFSILQAFLRVQSR